MPCEKLLDFLNKKMVEYEMVEHPKAYAAQDVALKAGVPGHAFAKSVLVNLDGEMAMAVIPAEHKVNFHVLRAVAGAQTISLAIETEFVRRFPDCELGAMPPFGNLYGIRVFLDDHLSEAETVSFNAGTHTEVITMAFGDFVGLVEPVVAGFTYRRLQEFKGQA